MTKKETSMVKMLVRRRRKTARVPRERRTPGRLRQFLGWCVHGYTALGLVIAGIIAVQLVEGGPAAFRLSFLLMLVATLVDSTDGTLARKVRIKEAVPSFDGRRLDDIIDFLTYTFLPLLLVYRAQILPAGYEACLLIPLVASVYGFCQVQAKTDDGYFLGFPSLWNVVAFYLYALPFGSWPSLAIVVVLALLTFVPSRYLYPSLPGKFNRVMTILSIPWTIAMVWVIWNLPVTTSRPDATLLQVAWLSLAYPVLYLGASWVITIKHWQKRPPASPELA
ncbi:MAG: CDP-alcohol phosphatidyltransferase family protein [Isosphaeraceae bacterium]